MRRELIAIVCTSMLMACGGGGKEKTAAAGDKDTLVIAFDGSPANLDPRIGTNTYDGRIWDMAASGVIKRTPAGGFTGDVAEKGETPADKTIAVHLNPGAKFQDVRPAT